MPEYLSPGVYVEELDTGARPIEQIGMSVCGFVGRAPAAGARPNEAIRVTGLEQFRRIFVGDAQGGTPLAYAVHGFFVNGGSVCYVVNVGDDGPLSGNGRGLDALEAIDEITMVAIPGRGGAEDYEAALTFAENRGDCVALLDGPERAEDTEALTRVATLDAEPDGKAAARPPGLAPRRTARGHAALYFPHLRLPRDPFAPPPDPLGPDAGRRPPPISVPPSGHVAGICARNDFRRGVHKSPANMTVNGVVGLSQIVSKADQSLLNPAGVNCFRSFPTEGVLLWGARTLAPPGPWTYLNVRRLFIMIEKSIERSTRWAVFEPNDQPLWSALRREITAFLTVLWQQKYLMGSSPEQAFFVKCDAETNPPEVVDLGRVVTLIGIAPVKPAEFVIFRVGQSQAGTTFDGI